MNHKSLDFLHQHSLVRPRVALQHNYIVRVVQLHSARIVPDLFLPPSSGRNPHTDGHAYSQAKYTADDYQNDRVHRKTLSGRFAGLAGRARAPVVPARGAERVNVYTFNRRFDGCSCGAVRASAADDASGNDLICEAGVADSVTGEDIPVIGGYACSCDNLCVVAEGSSVVGVAVGSSAVGAGNLH